MFGADRSAVALGQVVRDLGLEPRIVVPAQRPERGLQQLAADADIPYSAGSVGVVSSTGIEFPRISGGRNVPETITIINSSAALEFGRSPRRILVLREWLDPSSVRHRLLAYAQRCRTDTVAAVSSQALEQWRACVRGPASQHVDLGWLDQNVLDEATERLDDDQVREGIVFLGRFNNWKGQDVLADAYSAAFGGGRYAERPSLTFCGAQPGTTFGERAAELARRGEREGWTVTPFVFDPLPRLRSAALVVVPSLRPEPFGRVLLEALVSGCRVIAFDGGGPTDLAPLFPDAITLVQRDTGALADELRAWWVRGGTAQHDIERRKSLETLRTEFSPAAARARWSDILRVGQ